MMKVDLTPLKKLIFFCFVCLLLVPALKAQTIKNNLIVMGVIDSVHSKILNETRKLWVHVPARDTTFAQQKYPVVYLLDGDAIFPSFTGLIQQLSRAGNLPGNSLCPDMIVVGIPNTDRMRDLTIKGNPAVKNSAGENFTSFIEKELMPHIDSIYPTTPYKTLIGHSLGGLMVINTLVNHPDMFNDYIAIDPTMEWDRGILLNQAREVLKQKNYSGKHLFIGIANTMPKGMMDTTQARKDTSAATYHIRAILNLRDMIQSDTAANKLKFAYKYYPNDSHGSVPLITEYDALRFFFTNYDFPQDMRQKIFGKDSNPEAALAEIQSHYDNISKQMGYKVIPPEDVINLCGIVLITRTPKMAFPYLQLNIKNYPNSYNVYDSMGDYYDAVKDKTKAIAYYRKALTLKEFADTRSKLNKLLATKDTESKKTERK